MSIYEDIAMAHGWLDPARKRQIESKRREAKEDAKREAAEKHKRVHIVELTISKADDPYVKYGAGDDSSFNFLSSRRTPVVEKNLNPVWNHKDTIVLREDESIRFELWDKDLLKDDFQGAAMISADTFSRVVMLEQNSWEKSGSTQLQMVKADNHKLIFGIVHVSWVDKGVQK